LAEKPSKLGALLGEKENTIELISSEVKGEVRALFISVVTRAGTFSIKNPSLSRSFWGYYW